MFPVGDDRVQGGPAPIVTFALIALNVLAFLVELGQPSNAALQSFIQAWGVVPREYSTFRDLPPTIPLPFWSTLFTSMFLHGGWMHLIGNMVFLAIFGNNIEDVLGKVKFTLFYLFCGAAAGYAQVLLSPNSVIPTVGASGAIAGVLGAYYLLFPHSRVTCLVIFFFVTVIELPAGLVLGFWFLLQLVQGLFGLTQFQKGAGGVAYAAHVGGFIVGYLLMMLLGPRRPPRPRYYVPPEAFPPQ
jgi:rhomboid family protein